MAWRVFYLTTAMCICIAFAFVANEARPAYPIASASYIQNLADQQLPGDLKLQLGINGATALLEAVRDEAVATDTGVNTKQYGPSYNALEEALDALDTMQYKFFEAWLGDWPDAIDWTGALTGTYVSTMLNTFMYWIHQAPDILLSPEARYARRLQHENLINRYFGQITAYYFAEEAYSIRLQAYDDMLWVVLGWLEAIKFINTHDALHYRDIDPHDLDTSIPIPSSRAASWHGKQFEAAFAHRAHVFYDLVSRGWDERLCGGGLTWNPNLEPYKNTITNMLYISASVSMYLHHPGDDNDSPFLASANMRSDTSIPSNSRFNPAENRTSSSFLPPVQAHDPRHLGNAVRAYEWLQSVNMTNEQGLYVDGYHIHNVYTNGTHCDDRNEMVYTYNQGVVLSGLRGLWQATGKVDYLRDGHNLITKVITATGFHDLTPNEHNIKSYSESSSKFHTEGTHPPQWHGLGTNGILTELCDPFGTCSQDSQTFKGIFFHHLTSFCTPLPTSGHTADSISFVAHFSLAAEHARKCRAYTKWVELNAHAALTTRNDNGIFGMWWGWKDAEPGDIPAGDAENMQILPVLPRGSVDVRNHPQNESLALANHHRGTRRNHEQAQGPQRQRDQADAKHKDLNDRGRGRTLETQGAGLMVVRALHEFRRRFGKSNETDDA